MSRWYGVILERRPSFLGRYPEISAKYLRLDEKDNLLPTSRGEAWTQSGKLLFNPEFSPEFTP